MVDNIYLFIYLFKWLSKYVIDITHVKYIITYTPQLFNNDKLLNRQLKSK